MTSSLVMHTIKGKFPPPGLKSDSKLIGRVRTIYLLVWHVPVLNRSDRSAFQKLKSKVADPPSQKEPMCAVIFPMGPCLDYTETFVPIAKFASLRTVLALAAAEDMEVHSMDVSSVFLNGNLNGEIYMHQPEGFVVPGKECLIHHLKKSIYGLKQSPCQWYAKLHDTFQSIGTAWKLLLFALKLMIVIFPTTLSAKIQFLPAMPQVGLQWLCNIESMLL